MNVDVWMFAAIGVVCLTIVAVLLIISRLKNGANVTINKNGVLVSAKGPRTIQTKQFINFMKEIVTYVEDAKEQYVDDIIGIKQRFFKQSKDYAKSKLESVKNSIIEEYKVGYMNKYKGNPHSIQNENGERVVQPNVILPTLEQLENEAQKSVSPCASICSNGCNSGLSFFDSRLQKDFKPILEDVYRIIEENHLVNRTDREYEEEIVTKAEQLSTFLKNTVISYPVPIDNSIAKDVIDRKTPEVKEAIADALRRSRTLSMTKREVIAKEKDKYYRKRDTQIAQIINILNDEDICAMLKRTDQRLTDDND